MGYGRSRDNPSMGTSLGILLFSLISLTYCAIELAKKLATDQDIAIKIEMVDPLGDPQAQMESAFGIFSSLSMGLILIWLLYCLIRIACDFQKVGVLLSRSCSPKEIADTCESFVTISSIFVSLYVFYIWQAQPLPRAIVYSFLSSLFIKPFLGPILIIIAENFSY